MRLVSENVAETVLIAEDDPIVRLSVASALSREGFLPIEAASGAAALHQLRSHAGAIQWLVTDLRLGDACSGLHVALEYRFYNPMRPIVILSGARVSRAVARQTDVFVFPKPFDEDRLIRLLCRLRAARKTSGYAQTA